MHVLMIDDNEHDFVWINALIKFPDMTINWCKTIQKGLTYLASHPVDALLLDIDLKDTHNLDFLDTTNIQFPSLPIIILSAHDPDKVALEALQRGAQDWLVKGKVDEQVFEKTLRYAVARKQFEETLRKQFEETLTRRVEEEQEFQKDLKALHEVMVGLTNLDDLDEIYQQAVKRGLEDLGFDRFGLLLYNPDGSAQGTYGTDAQGNLWAEHHLRFTASQLPNILQQAIQREDRFALDEYTRLSSERDTIGMGWNAVAVLWDGSEKLGWLATDNAVHQLPLKQRYLDILALYALTLGTLLGQKRTQIAVRENERRLRLLAQNSPDIIYTIDLNNSQVNYLNRTELFGYQHTELKAEIMLIEVTHPDDKERLNNHWRTFLEAADPNRSGLIEYRIQDKSGQWRWLQSRQTIYMSDDDGKPAQILITWTEITERKQAEESLRQERDLLRTLIDSLPDYILVKDREGRVVISNAAHAQTTGLMPDELITKTAFEMLPIDVSARLRTEDQEIMQSGRAIINMEREVIGKNKNPETILITKIPLRDTTGHITGLIAVGRDITERKQLEAQSIELANERGRITILQRFIHDMSHDFRTPLSIINNSLYLLQKSIEPEKQQLYVERAKEQILRLDKLLNELLQMKNLDAKEVHFDLKMTNINPLLAQLVYDYQQIAMPKHITLHLVSTEDVCFAKIDSIEFIRAMTKLLDNALAYTSEQGTVTIHTSTQGSWAMISVQDTGIGIEKNDLPHIFERFYRADQARSTTNGSSGLGLSIVQKIVEAHNGIIEVDSLVGQGSTFTLKLPVS